MTEDKLKQAIHQAIEQATVKVFGLSGTGFFITADGYVLTAYHCIRTEADIRDSYFPKKIRVQLISGEMLEAQLDQEKSVPNSDVAVLKVNYAPESCLPLGTEAEIHDDVVALGYPAAYLYESSPLGVYSGKISRFPTDTLIETDAVKGKGHSGSALYHYDSKRVIGVLSEVYEPQVMTNAGLVVRLEPLFAKWPELHNINQEVAEIWEQKVKILTEEVAKIWEKRKKPQPEVQLTPRELRNRRDLLSQVKGEVNSRLEQSLHNASFINIDKESQPQQVKLRLWDVEVKVVSQPNESYFLPRSKEIIDIFDDEPIAGKLLILGEPGSGKTTTLLELAKELVNRAENNPAEPLPILLNFSSWKGDKSVDQWIIEELKSKYGVHKKIGKEWVESGQLLPLLDGLDELESSRQEPMIKEINRFLESDKRPLYLVICSRREEYELQKVQLQLNAAVCLQPLTEVQIRTYLRSAECLPLWESFQNDAALYELAKSPFFLSVIVLSASEISFEDWAKLSSSEERQQYLFEIYTKKMLSRNLKKRYYLHWFEPSVEETQHWLEELAIRLEREKESEFLVEKLQSSEPAYRALFAISSVLIAVLVGLVTSFNQWYLPFSFGKYDNEPYKAFSITLFIVVVSMFGITCRNFYLFDRSSGIKVLNENPCYNVNFLWIIIYLAFATYLPYITLKFLYYFFGSDGIFWTIIMFIPIILIILENKKSFNEGVRKNILGMVAFLLVIIVLPPFIITWILFLMLSIGNMEYHLNEVIRGSINLIYWINFGLFISLWNYISPPIKLLERVQLNLLRLARGFIPVILVFLTLYIVGIYESFQAIDEREASNIRWVAEEPLASWIHGFFISIIPGNNSTVATIMVIIAVGSTIFLVFSRRPIKEGIKEFGKTYLVKLFAILLLFFLIGVALLFGMIIIMAAILFIIRCIMPPYYFISCTFNNSNCLIFHNIFFPNLFNYPDDILFISLLIIGGLFYGIVGPTIDIDKRKFPNQGIRNTLINAVIFLLVGGLFFGTASLVVYDKQTSLTNGIIIGLLIGLFVGRAYLQHYVLRTILWLKGEAPFFYVKFLDYATERMFIQRIGGRYRFIHKLLQEHFAKEESLK